MFQSLTRITHDSSQRRGAIHRALYRVVDRDGIGVITRRPGRDKSRPYDHHVVDEYRYAPFARRAEQ